MPNAKPHVLFVCGQNRWRSPTAARIYANDQRIEVLSAGLSPQSPHRLSLQDLKWADLVLVMEIHDDYGLMDDTLAELIRTGTEARLLAKHGLLQETVDVVSSP